MSTIGSRGLVIRHLPCMREMLGSNPLWGNNLCSPSPLQETKNHGPNTSIPTINALICEKLKDPGISSKVVINIIGIEGMSVTEQITSMHKNKTC